MKILILANNDVGLYQFRRELIEALLKRKDTVILSLPDGDLVKPLTDAGCDFIDTPVDRRGVNPVRDFSLLIRYFKLLNREKPDLVINYTIKPNVYGGLACRIKGIPYAANITGLGTAFQRDGWLKNNGVSTQNFLMFYSLVTNGLYIYCLRRYSDRLPLAIFLFFAVGAYIFTGAAIKQSIAMAICMASLGLALKKKWIPFILMVALASTFHPYSLMYLMVPFLTFRPWTRRTYWMLAAFILVGFGLEQLLGTVVDITSMMGEEYDVASFSEEGVNIFRVLVCNVPTVLTFLFQKQLFKDSSRGENLMVNLCMLNGAIMFVGLFGTANYFARLANYFVLAQAIALPWILGKLKGRTRSVLTAAMVVCYLGYFIYGNVFDQPFDMDFNRLTLDEYFIAFFQ